jgi:hypothetical protein
VATRQAFDADSPGGRHHDYGLETNAANGG